MPIWVTSISALFLGLLIESLDLGMEDRAMFNRITDTVGGYYSCKNVYESIASAICDKASDKLKNARLHTLQTDSILLFE